ncbi:hypothetical protein REC12_25270 [Desulfosporosinus sp. PR]|uniref:hypothetical protein n=1 Tax=Candidatus Desulfosporosinus nitrosoreducens TaxID=3401928 RepID=UPI0027EB1FEE|nr:hypothetical protein [Desulfosporosinus sp. PR]MDQ7096910.1 hypothetical protein [Desulfosporosinus sp. PR]
MIVPWHTTNACKMFCDHCYRDGGCRARAAFYNEGDYMAEEPWRLYHGRKGA